jgi:hypothetical protein
MGFGFVEPHAFVRQNLLILIDSIEVVPCFWVIYSS